VSILTPDEAGAAQMYTKVRRRGCSRVHPPPGVCLSGRACRGASSTRVSVCARADHGEDD
jgi:hypothetical protein